MFKKKYKYVHVNWLLKMLNAADVNKIVYNL